MPTGRILTITVATAGLLVTACGDDTEALSKPEFIEQADAICQATSDELEPVFETVWEGVDDWDEAAFEELILVRFDEAMDTAEPAWLRQVDDIRALAPPDDDREILDTLIDDFEAAVTDVAATIEAAAAGDEAARARMDSEDEDPFADINRRARDYGLIVCGDDSE